MLVFDVRVILDTLATPAENYFDLFGSWVGDNSARPKGVIRIVSSFDKIMMTMTLRTHACGVGAGQRPEILPPPSSPFPKYRERVRELVLIMGHASIQSAPT